MTEFPASQKKGLKKNYIKMRFSQQYLATLRKMKDRGRFTPFAYCPSWSGPYMPFLSASPDTSEKISFLFASSVYLCPSLATLFNYCMCERGHRLIIRLKKIEDFSESLQQYFFNSLICCKKKPMELWIIVFCRKLTSNRRETDSNQ